MFHVKLWKEIKQWKSHLNVCLREEEYKLKNVYSITSDDFGVKVFTEQNDNKDMTYYSGYFIISMEKEGI